MFRTVLYAVIASATFIGFFVAYAMRPAVSASQFPAQEIITFQTRAPRSSLPISNRLTVVNYNIGYASGKKNNQPEVLTEEEVISNLDWMIQNLRERNADILCLQEVDFRAERTLDINQLEYLAKGLDLPYTAYVVVWNKNYLPWPYWPPTAHYGRIVSGQAILSRFPIKSQDIFYFKKPSANAFWYNWFYPDKVVQKVTIQWGKKLLGVWNLHLEAFRREARLEQAKVLIDQFQKQTGSAHIVAGDFNSVSAYRNDLTAEKKAKLEDRGESIQLILEETGLKNVEGKPPYFSMPSWDPIKKIDHILYDDFSLQLKQGGNLRLIASDHLPVWAEFNKR